MPARNARTGVASRKWLWTSSTEKRRFSGQNPHFSLFPLQVCGLEWFEVRKENLFKIK
jgi:hypothetical protein